MLLIISLIFTLLEIKDLKKDKKIKLLIFFSILIIISIFVYINKNNIDSLSSLIDKLKGMFYGDD